VSIANANMMGRILCYLATIVESKVVLCIIIDKTISNLLMAMVKCVK